MNYLKKKVYIEYPRIPLSGYLDLTYRCNIHCRHCWTWLPESNSIKPEELSYQEIILIVDDARKMGCRNWHISGGEPMLREDFTDIFEYISSKSALYSLNTNGTLITPKIASLMKRRGEKWIALYGADASVYDHITRVPGSFERAMRGMHYLKEAGAGFTVQIIPMKDNYHQYEKMVELTKTLSPRWRLSSPWFYLSASGNPAQNKDIISQRLDPKLVVKHNPTDMTHTIPEEKCSLDASTQPEGLFDQCINAKRDFHIDPYGKMTFCSLIKDDSLRYDLKKGSFKKGWEEFIPSLKRKVSADAKYKKTCGHCDSRANCGWCPVYSYLEKGDYTSKIEYLCELEDENKKYRENWYKHYRIHFKIAGFTIQVNSDLPFPNNPFIERFDDFKTDQPGDDIVINHHFGIPDWSEEDLGEKIYKHYPLQINKKGNSWIYMAIVPGTEDVSPYQVAVFNHNFSRVRIYNHDKELFLKGNLNAITLMSSDQIHLAQFLAFHSAIIMHSSGIVHNNRGYLFVGHSEAGKSTMVKMVKNRVQILCDDRNIIRKWPDGFKIHGTWSHGEIPLVSNRSAPLHGIYILKHSQKNKIVRIRESREVFKIMLACLIKPYCDSEWWNLNMTLIEELIKQIPCYNLFFDKSGAIVDLLFEKEKI